MTWLCWNTGALVSRITILTNILHESTSSQSVNFNPIKCYTVNSTPFIRQRHVLHSQVFSVAFTPPDAAHNFKRIYACERIYTLFTCFITNVTNLMLILLFYNVWWKLRCDVHELHFDEDALEHRNVLIACDDERVYKASLRHDPLHQIMRLHCCSKRIWRLFIAFNCWKKKNALHSI